MKTFLPLKSILLVMLFIAISYSSHSANLLQPINFKTKIAGTNSFNLSWDYYYDLAIDRSKINGYVFEYSYNEKFNPLEKSILIKFDISDTLNKFVSSMVSSDMGVTWSNYMTFSGTPSKIDTIDVMHYSVNLSLLGSFAEDTIFCRLYAYYLKSTSPSSNLSVLIKNKDPRSIKITGKPPTYAVVGEKYTYALSTKIDSVYDPIYNFEIPSLGVSKNFSTPNIEWTFQMAGKYEIQVIVFSQSDKTIFDIQKYIVNVMTCKSPANIVCKIVNEDNQPVKLGIVTATKYTADSQVDYVLSASVSLGEAIISADKGKYKLFFNGLKTYSDRETYDTLTVNCNDTIIYNIKTSAILPEKNATIKGRVTRKSDGSPLYTLITFTGKSNSNAQPVDYNVATNSQGYYSILVSNKYEYVAKATLYDTVGNNATYCQLFYGNTTDVLEAKKISVKFDTVDNINIQMDDCQFFSNSLSGKVIDVQGNGIPKSYLVAYRVSDLKGKDDNISFSKTTMDGNDGNYGIENLIEGKYVLLAIPMDINYVPAYYNSNGTFTYYWKDATFISVSNSSVIPNLNIALQSTKGIMPGGNGLKGNIKKGGGIAGKNANIQADGPAIGAVVYVFDNSNNIVTYSIADQNGDYTINGLNKSTYSLSIDKLLFEKYERSKINFQVDGEIQTIDATLIKAILGNVDEYAYNNNKVFPNPAQNIISINSEEYLNQNVSMTIVDALGNLISTQNINIDNNQTNINISKIPTGHYFIRLISKDKKTIYPLQITR